MLAYNSEKDLADMYVTSKASLSTPAEIASEFQKKKDTEFARQFLEEEAVARYLAQVKMDAEYEHCLKERMVIKDEEFARRLEERMFEKEAKEAEEAVARRLAQVKMKAEFERRLKERIDAEFEAKVEAKAHELFSRVEEQRELTEIQIKLKQVHWNSQEKFLQQNTTFLDYLIKTSQIPLHTFCGLNVFSLAEPIPYGYVNHHIILTNKNILMVFHQATNPEEIAICPIYSFIIPLNLKQTQMFLNMALYNPSKMNGPYITVYDSPKRIESIIRSVPGKYSNGHWTQLDGFFGMYLNEDTMELSAVPPPL